MREELLIKYLNNRCTEDEVDEVLNWFKSEASSVKGKKIIKNDWDLYSEEEELAVIKDYDALLDKVHHKINTETKRDVAKTDNGINLRVFTTWVTRVAAILLLPVLALLFYILANNTQVQQNDSEMLVQTIEITAPIGSRTKMELPDGSVVHLNYGSKLEYPLTFTGSTREVSLTGEGFFDVAHNPEKPFIVKTKNLNVKALGTIFNVTAYPGQDKVKTTLVEGKVVLEKTENNVVTKSIGAMVPGQHVEYDIKTEKIHSEKGDIERFIGWKDGKLVFYKANIAEVAHRLNHMFNVDIEIDDEVKDYSYSVTFVDEPLFQILDLMTLATPIEYKTYPRKKLADGTFSKQKIVITKRK